MDISNTDFVNSFLKAARARKLSVVVIYGEMVGMKAKMKLVSNVGEAGTKGVLTWLRGAEAAQQAAAPSDIDTPTEN